MSRTKAFLFDNLPADEALKADLARERSAVAASLPVRIPTRRRNVRPGKHWDPLWPSCLSRAAAELDVACMQINDGLHVATDEQAKVVLRRATAMLEERHERLSTPPRPTGSAAPTRRSATSSSDTVPNGERGG